MTEMDALRLARDAYDRADMFTAARHIERVLAEPPTGNRLGWVRITAGEIYRSIGDAAQAVRYLTELLDGWDEYQTLRTSLEPYAYHNLGLAYRQQRRYAEALDCSRQAGILWRQQGFAAGVVWSHLNRAWVLCLLDRADEAHKLLELIAPLVGELDDTECLWGLRLGLAHVAITKGDCDKAVRLAGVLINQSDTVPVGILAQAHVIAGRAFLGAGDTTKARGAAAAALEVALKSGDSRVMNDVQTLRRRIHHVDCEGA